MSRLRKVLSPQISGGRYFVKVRFFWNSINHTVNDNSGNDIPFCCGCSGHKKALRSMIQGLSIWCCSMLYSVADSMRFMFANMNTPAMRQIVMSTTQIDQSGIRIQRSPGTDTR